MRTWLVAVACGAVVALPAPSLAETPVDAAPPVATYLSIERADVSRTRVLLSAERGIIETPGTTRVCVEADRTIVRGETKTRTTEIACEMAEGFRFDPVGWTASIRDTFDSTLYVERYRRVRDRWRMVSTTSTRSAITVDLAWVGTGGERADHRYHPPSVGICYSLFPCVRPAYVTVTRERRAEVSGRLRFPGLGLHATLPRGHGGMMRWVA
jgi:hypothetical protein